MPALHPTIEMRKEMKEEGEGMRQRKNKGEEATRRWMRKAGWEKK